MKPRAILNGVVDSLNSAQTCFYETNYGSRSSRQSGQSARQGNRKKLVQTYRSTASRKTSRLEEAYGLLFGRRPEHSQLKSDCLTLTAGRPYTGDSRWERHTSLRASCRSTRRSFGLPSGICELNLTLTGSLLPLCAASRTYEHR